MKSHFGFSTHRRRLLAALMLWAAGAHAQGQGAELTVSAAASLQNAFQEIGVAYEKAQPGLTLNFNFAASGPLLAQIAQGAPVDVFASADTDTMDRAQAMELIVDASRADITANELVLISPIHLPPRLKTLADLNTPEVQRIAIGNPATVPAGRYARDALSAQGLWTPLAAKSVHADNVRQALHYVSRGEVQAGFVYRTDAYIKNGKVRIDFAVPTPKRVLYPAAVVRASRRQAAAAEFVAYLRSPAAQAVLRRHGFAAPEGTPLMRPPTRAPAPS